MFSTNLTVLQNLRVWVSNTLKSYILTISSMFWVEICFWVFYSQKLTGTGCINVLYSLSAAGKKWMHIIKLFMLAIFWFHSDFEQPTDIPWGFNHFKLNTYQTKLAFQTKLTRNFFFPLQSSHACSASCQQERRYCTGQHYMQCTVIRIFFYYFLIILLSCS